MVTYDQDWYVIILRPMQAVVPPCTQGLRKIANFHKGSAHASFL